MDKRIILLPLLAIIILTVVVKADIAPPMMTINVTYNGNPVAGTFYSTALICSNSSVGGGSDIPQLNISLYDPATGCYWTNGNFGGMCDQSFCRFQYFSPYLFKVAFYLPDLNRTFITNSFNSTVSFNYDAKLYQNGTATIDPAASPTPPPVYGYALGIFVISLLLTLVIELIVAFIYLKLTKAKGIKRVLLFVAIANMISLPIVWFAFVLLLGGLGLFLGEIFAVIFEGSVIYYFNRKALTLRSAMLMSVIMNILSLIIGGIALILFVA